MRTPAIAFLACALLGGCASQPAPPPAPPPAQLNQGLVMSTAMMAILAQDKGPSDESFWQVRIPAPALAVLDRIAAHRRATGRWPGKGELPLPEGVKDAFLAEAGPDLDVTIVGPSFPMLQCRMLADGTVMLTPAIYQMMRSIQASRQNGGTQ